MTSLSLEVILLGIVNFIFIGILPRIFFRADGTFNLRWWATAGPLFVSPFVLVLCWFGYLPVFEVPANVHMFLKGFAVLLHSASIALIAYTLGCHRIPLALWHQNNDAPKAIVTWGAYKKIRHPFYTSFILGLIASNLHCPQWLNLAALVVGFIVLNFTANNEEKHLSASEFGKDYQDYMKVTGRFFPKF